MARIKACVVAMTLGGCAYVPVKANVSEERVSPPTMMTASPIALPLYVVISPDQVPDEIDIENLTHSLEGFRSFLGLGMKDLMDPYFERIEVVESKDALPSRGAVVVDTRLDQVEARNLRAGGATYSVLWMQWSVGIRMAEDSDYLYTFAGAGKSDLSYRSLKQGAKQMMKSALSNLLEGMTEKDVLSAIASRSQSLSQPSEKDESPATEI
jgi:hypothetical protein